MNDLVYNELVVSPGFELDFAVGTTYSLDAKAFLALSLSFSGLGEISDNDFKNPIRLLEGIRQAIRKIAIFCNRGGLIPPEQTNPLYAMLDKCVFEVFNKYEPLANFHPKIWIIKERSLQDRNLYQIKLIVLSRNLTKDTSLDVAVAMTAPLGKVPDEKLKRKHEPLKLMLEELSKFADPDKRKKIKGFILDLDSMGEFELSNKFIDYDFVPLHFGKNLNRSIDLKREMPGEKMMIISPFIDKESIIFPNGLPEETPVTWLNGYGKKQKKVLITRLESLTPQIMEFYSEENREVWVMSPLAEQNDIMPLNLHAKMYFTGRNRDGNTFVWIGSANATHSGFYRNSEFLLRLTLKRGKNLFESFMNEFCDEKKQLCHKIESLQENTSSQTKNNILVIKIKRNLLGLNNLAAEVITSENGYKVRISARKIKDIPGVITLAPIQEPYNEKVLSQDSKECIIPISKVSNLSKLYILSVTPLDGRNLEPVKMVVTIPTKGIPNDRDDRIFRSLIDSPAKFLNYVEMMITDRPMELSSLFTIPTTNDKGCPVGTKPKNAVAALYESLLRTVVTNPEKIEDIQDLIERLDKENLPESFLQMANMLNESLKKLRK